MFSHHPPLEDLIHSQVSVHPTTRADLQMTTGGHKQRRIID
jgi:hypothetical protein